jgi:hypothetical protein
MMPEQRRSRSGHRRAQSGAACSSRSATSRSPGPLALTPGGSTAQAAGAGSSVTTSTERSRRTTTASRGTATYLAGRCTSRKHSAWRHRLRAHRHGHAGASNYAAPRRKTCTRRRRQRKSGGKWSYRRRYHGPDDLEDALGSTSSLDAPSTRTTGRCGRRSSGPPRTPATSLTSP